MKKICDRVIEYSFYLLFFLVPLILTPWNYELFEFNKMLLTFFFSTLILSAWLIKMVLEKKLIFRRTPLDIPLLLFFISQFIATIYSIDRHTSLWGYYSRFNGGLLSTFSYLSLYWAFVANMDKAKTKRLIQYTLLSTLLVAAYGIAEHFGIDAQYWVQDVQNRVFSTLGQPNWLAAWLVALIPLTWAFILKQKGKLLILNSLLLFIFYLCLLYTKSRSGLMGLAGAYLVFWGLIGFINKEGLKKLAQPFATITLILVILTALVGTPWTPHLGQIKEKVKPSPPPQPEATVSAEAEPIPLITESGDIRKIVWQGAIEIWKNHPFTGTGAETFAYSYYWYRPREHNDVSEWDFLYNKAHNEYLTLLANTGLIGLLTYLSFICLFILWTIKYIFKRKRERPLIITLLAGFISILITNFFGFSVVAVNLLFFLIPAMAITLPLNKKIEPKPKKERRQELETKQWLSLILISLVTLFTLFYLAKFWYADTRFALAEKLNNSAWYEKGFNELQTALALHPTEPYYHVEMAQALAGLATLAHEVENASLSAEFANQAIAESDYALTISPYHLNFWKKRAKMFNTLVKVDPQYYENVQEALFKAAELAPTDAKILYNLGVVYDRLNQKEKAVETLEKTIELKPNFLSARHALASLYQEQGQKKEAREQLEYILEKINPADEKAQTELKKL